jgi:hypothetical protein
MVKSTARFPYSLLALLWAFLFLTAALSYGQKFAVTAPPVTPRPATPGPATPGPATAQDVDFPVNGFSAPVLGYVVDAAGWVRKMPGLAGASWLTARLEFGVRLAAGVVSPRQDYILGLAVPDRRAVVLPVAAGPGNRRSGTARPLDGVDPGADVVVLSPTGTAAAFYFIQAASLVIVTGLPDAPAPSGRLDLSSLPGPAAALAIADDGSLVLASAATGGPGSATGDGAAVFALSTQSPPRLLLNGGDFPAIVFLRNSTDAVLADRRRNALYRVRDAAGAGAVVLLASEGDGVSAPLAVAASADSTRFFLANAGSTTSSAGSSATIGYMSAAGGPLTLLPCSCSPSALAPLSGNAVFRLTEVSGGPLWLLDGDAIEPRLLLVPQVPATGARQ